MRIILGSLDVLAVIRQTIKSDYFSNIFSRMFCSNKMAAMMLILRSEKESILLIFFKLLKWMDVSHFCGCSNFFDSNYITVTDPIEFFTWKIVPFSALGNN